jgi:hypothetical protein
MDTDQSNSGCVLLLCAGSTEDAGRKYWDGCHKASMFEILFWVEKSNLDTPLGFWLISKFLENYAGEWAVVAKNPDFTLLLVHFF